MKAFKVLLRILVSIITILNEEGFKVYDAENRDCYISNIDFCNQDKILIVSFKEEDHGREEDVCENNN